MIKQFVPEEICLKCKGCCRFTDAQSAWLPCLLDKEIKALSKDIASGLIFSDKKIQAVGSGEQDIFFCPFLNAAENKCKIYGRRPFECRLYPFLINCHSGKIFLSVDLNCHFAKQNLKDESFKGYVGYLTSLLNNESYRSIFKNNPQILQTYTEALDLVELKI